MVANLSSTSCPEPGPSGHSSFVSMGTFSSLELHEAQSHSIICFTIYIVYKKWHLCWHCFHLQKHAPSSANTELMLANLSSISCSEPLPIDHTSFVSVGASLSLESQEARSQSIICFTIYISNKKWCLSWPCFHLQKLAPFSANSELMLANHSSTSCPWPPATGHTSFVLVGTSLSLEPQEAQSQCIICFTICIYF